MKPKKGKEKELKSRNTSRDVTFDMELLESSLQQKIDAKDPFMSPNCCIFKIPKILFRNKPKAFLPNAFSIGPFHRGKKHLKATEKIKHKYMQSLVRRSKVPMSLFIEIIEKIEKDTRDCYEGPIVLSKTDFIEMLILDGCFLIELFLKYVHEELKDEDDPIFSRSCFVQCLGHDLILLENQIPWTVLELLYKQTAPNSVPLDVLAILYFGHTFSYGEPSFDSLFCTHFAKHKSKHILDLIRNWLVLSSKREGSSQTSGSGQENHNQTAGPRDEGSNQSLLLWQRFPSATNLKEAGVKFKKVIPDSILDVNFTNGTLEIPSLVIHEHTENIFRNLICLEQCTPNYSPKITSYVILMDNLIDTTKDMEILCRKKIIDNWLHPEDATQSFNKLYDDAYPKEFYYLNLCNQVNEYCERSLPKWRAILMHNYFSSPWAIVGVIFGATAWILAFLQTYYTIKR